MACDEMAGRGFIPPHGGYEHLLSYRKAQIVYAATVYFCDRYIGKRSRTHDQMVQAARSGKQNIIEGSMASRTSKEAEIKLTNVARASLEELLEDYRDFLRTRSRPLWDKDSKAAQAVRRLASAKGGGDESHKSHRSHATHGTHVTYETFRPYIETRSPETVANIIICLIHHTNYLLDRQLRRLEADFLKAGGLRERMTRARLQERGKGRL